MPNLWNRHPSRCGPRRSLYAYKGKKTVIRSVKGKFCDNRECGEVVMDKEESARTSKEMREFSKRSAISK